MLYQQLFKFWNACWVLVDWIVNYEGKLVHIIQQVFKYIGLHIEQKVYNTSTTEQMIAIKERINQNNYFVNDDKLKLLTTLVR